MQTKPRVRAYVEPPKLSRVLRYGVVGDDVKTVQHLLLAEGYFSGTPLGNFLAITRDAVKYFQNTHIGKDGSFLEPDGVVGNKTWWALHNPHGSAQKSHIPTGTTSVKVGDRAKIIRFLYKLHAKGVKEIPNGSNYGDGVTPIVNACGYRYGIEWCLALQSYAYKEVTGKAPLGAMHVGCSLFWNEAAKRGRAFVKGAYEPIPGDIAIYNYKGGLKKGNVLVGSGHAVGVVRVASDGSMFNGIEGNAGNRVKHSIRKVSEKTLVGYVNLFGDESNPPEFQKGILDAPALSLSLADSR